MRELSSEKEENYVFVVSASDLDARINTLKGVYRAFEDAEEHRFDGFNGDIRMIRSKILD